MPSEQWNESRESAHDAAARGTAGTSSLPEPHEVIAGLRATITAPGVVSMLSPEGVFTPHPDFDLDPTPELVRDLYRDMVLVRRFDREGNALQRQGQLGLWVPLLGQEAAQVGSGRALRPQDMAFPSYREHGVAWCRGIDPVELLSMFRGVDHGGWDPKETRFHSYTIVIGDQALHAVGYAMGMELRRRGRRRGDRDEATIAFFGDGATSQGDVHEAFVFAAAYNAPVVFYCQNNQWAISEPVERAVPGAAVPAGAAASASPASGSTATTCWPASRSPAGARRVPATGNGPDADRGLHLPDGRAHHLRRPDPVPDGGETRDVEAAAIRSSGSGVYLAREAGADAAFFDAVEAEADELAARVPGRAAAPSRIRGRATCSTTSTPSRTTSVAAQRAEFARVPRRLRRVRRTPRARSH